MIPETFRTDILKEETDANKVLVENSNAETGSFALLFEFDGDVKEVLSKASAAIPRIYRLKFQREKPIDFCNSDQAF